jgi:hypothetical protein
MIKTEVPSNEEPDDHRLRPVQGAAAERDPSFEALPQGVQKDNIEGAVDSDASESRTSSLRNGKDAHVVDVSEPDLDDKQTDKPTPLPQKDFTPSQKLGRMNAYIIFGGVISILVVLAFLLFLWLAHSTNTTWLLIISRNWLTKAVSISADALKHASLLQIGISGAILAALSLESHQVLLPDAAAVSIQRTGQSSSAVPKLLRALLREGNHSHRPFSLILVLGGLLSLSLALMMPLSVILLSDIQPGALPGEIMSTATTFGLNYSAGVDLPTCFENNWLKRPPFYPAFAEYSEPPLNAEDISDTGRTLRAFLPFSLAQQREGILQYAGQTTVLDARVVCLAPKLGSVTLNDAVGAGVATNTTLAGDFQAVSVGFQSGNMVIEEVPGTSFPFACSISLADTLQWPMTLCQIAGADGDTALGLPSEFDNSTLGFLYMAINASTTSTYPALANFTQGLISNETRGEWAELVWHSYEPVLWNASLSTALSLSLCFTAFDTADISVQISGSQNRSEPSPTRNGAQMEFGDIRKQLGQPSMSGISAERGILSISPKDSWTAVQADRASLGNWPYVQSYAAMAYSSGFDICSEAFAGNASACFFESDAGSNEGTNGEAPPMAYPFIHADQTLVGIFQEVLQDGGSIAFAVQCMVTLLSSMAYYDVLPLFNRTGAVNQQFEIIANIPVRRTGLFVVIGIQAMHVVLTGVILWVYMRRSKYSTLGNPWQAVAQLVSPQTVGILEAASTCSKTEVDVVLKSSGRENLVVGLENVTGRVCLVEHAELEKRGQARPPV